MFLRLQNAYWDPVCISGSSPDLGSFVFWISCRVCVCVWEVGGRREGGGQLLPCGWSMSVFWLTVSCCFSSDMVLKPRAAVSITVLQYYTSSLEWHALFLDLCLEWDWSLVVLPGPCLLWIWHPTCWRGAAFCAPQGLPFYFFRFLLYGFVLYAHHSAT